MNKMALVVLLLASTFSNAAVRCQGQLIGVGDAEYALVKACGEPESRHVINNGGGGGFGDEAYLYYKIDGQTVEIHMIDGHIHQIGDSLH